MFDMKKYRKVWREKNRDKIRLYGYTYSQKNPQKILLLSAKHRSIKKGVSCTISEADIHIPTKCPVLGTPIEKVFNADGKRGAYPNSPSLDRIDNLKGYEKGNIQVISSKANSMKNSATPEELLNFAFWVILTYGHLIEENKQHVD
jgi:hypothetical protein